MHMAVDAHGMPLRIIVTEGSGADCKQAPELIEGFCAENLLADKAYDTNHIIDCAEKINTKIVIPSKRNRKVQRDIDTYLYKLRHIIENTFLKFKRWRGIATRYCKNDKSFLAMLQIRSIFMWAEIS